MCKSFVLISALLAFQVIDAKVKPRDLVDEVQEQLKQLKSLIQGEILAARQELNWLRLDLVSFSDTLLLDVRIGIVEIYEDMIGRVSTLKELANGAGKDVSSCTDSNEAMLKEMSVEVTTEFMNFTISTDTEAISFLKDAEYLVDININKIYNLENQVDRCGNNIICLQPIVTEIQLDMVRLPISIETEVNAFSSRLRPLEEMIYERAKTVITYFNSQSNVIVADIMTCINIILGRL